MFLFKQPQKAASAHVWAATAHSRRTSGTLSTVYNRLQAFQVVSTYAFETHVEMRHSNIQAPLYNLLLLLLLLLHMSGSMLAVANTSLFCTPNIVVLIYFFVTPWSIPSLNGDIKEPLSCSHKICTKNTVLLLSNVSKQKRAVYSNNSLKYGHHLPLHHSRNVFSGFRQR